jgi:hypothetical protein
MITLKNNMNANKANPKMNINSILCLALIILACHQRSRMAVGVSLFKLITKPTVRCMHG